MSRLVLLSNALEYIEENLVEDIRTEEIAKACFCSKSTLEKLFQDINHISIHDYIVRRRMMKGARLLISNRQAGILEISLQVGYNSHEAFTRAFKQVWNCKPSQFRKQEKYTELFPRLCLPNEGWDEYMQTRRQCDISELYDLFVARKNCYFVCCDIKSLIPINEIDRKAGDMAIITTLKRMNEAAGEKDVVFRIGGDEFVMMTDSEEEAYAEKRKEQILSKNGECFEFEGKQIPLSVYVVTTRLYIERMKYNELFCKLHKTLQDAK